MNEKSHLTPGEVGCRLIKLDDKIYHFDEFKIFSFQTNSNEHKNGIRFRFVSHQTITECWVPKLTVRKWAAFVKYEEESRYSYS